ncbi:MAG: hypothetical protein NZ730_03950 [Porticoccaceae bacterium]|nr:hypothetical protein [Porticoccaceae bacterium]
MAGQQKTWPDSKKPGRTAKNSCADSKKWPKWSNLILSCPESKPFWTAKNLAGQQKNWPDSKKSWPDSKKKMVGQQMVGQQKYIQPIDDCLLRCLRSLLVTTLLPVRREEVRIPARRHRWSASDT